VEKSAGFELRRDSSCTVYFLGKKQNLITHTVLYYQKLFSEIVTFADLVHLAGKG